MSQQAVMSKIVDHRSADMIQFVIKKKHELKYTFSRLCFNIDSSGTMVNNNTGSTNNIFKFKHSLHTKLWNVDKPGVDQLPSSTGSCVIGGVDVFVSLISICLDLGKPT